MSVASTLKRYRVVLVSILFVLFFFIVYFFNAIFIYIYPGQAGILFKVLSDVPIETTVYKEGLYVVAPWNRMYVYDTTQQKKTVDVDALTNNGLHIGVRISAVFHPDPEALKELIVHIGADYTEKILTPILFSAVRKTIGKYPPEELYTSARHGLQDEILAEAVRELATQPFILENLILEKLNLPTGLNQAIEDKLRLQQEALAYEFILKKEMDEAKRRQIEAESIKNYQNTVGANLNADILRWLEIRAMHDLAQSQNGKVVIMGGANALPLVLDAEGRAGQ